MIAKLFALLFGDKSSSAPPPNVQAKKRLQVALLYDKLDVSDEMIRNLQKDLVGVLSKYFEIDHDAMRLDITREDEGVSALMLNTPIISAKRMVSVQAEEVAASGESRRSDAPKAEEKSADSVEVKDAENAEKLEEPKASEAPEGKEEAGSSEDTEDSANSAEDGEGEKEDNSHANSSASGNKGKGKKRK